MYIYIYFFKMSSADFLCSMLSINKSSNRIDHQLDSKNSHWSRQTNLIHTPYEVSYEIIRPS